MSSLFGLNKPNTDLRKNVFDLSEKSLFSMSSGMLLPCYVKDMNPGEKAKIQMSALTRTQPLNTAAFVRSRQYFHYFFVPYKQLWSGWDNFIYGVNYKTSSLQYGKSYNKVPRLDLLKALSALLKDGYIIDKDAHTSRVRRNASAAGATIPTGKLSRKDYGSSTGVDEDVDGFRPAFSSSSTIQPNHNHGKDELGFEYFQGISRLLDMLGYGMRDGGGRLTDFNCSSLSDIVRIAENPNSAESLDALCNSMKSANFSVNPFRLLAYQKIYSDFYKRDDYQSTDPLSFNVDDVDEFIPTDITGSPAQRVKAYSRLIGMLRMRYRWLPKDYFTGVVPSELYNVANAFEFMGTDGARSFNDKGKRIIDGVGFDENSAFLHVNAGSNTSTTVSTKSIRAAFAIEKLLRLTRRAGGHDYISQTAAHYGFEPSKGRGDKVQFLGGYSSNINISEVLTTANTDDGATGMMYGKGVGGLEQGKDIEFTAQEHGVLMCITSIVPDLDYPADGLDRFNAKFERGDYFHPEFQDLGLQPVFGYELKNYWRYNGSGSGSDVLSYRNQVLGFVPMYSEYKTSYDKVHGEFKNGKSLSAWSARHLVGYSSDGRDSFDGVRIASLLINPRCLNSLFSVHFDGDEMTDQFMVNAQFVVKMIRPMSITGQNL